MIGKLKGVVDLVGEGEGILDVQGVGYLVFAGARTLRALQPGEAAALYIETEVREDAIRLYGFLRESERAWFARLRDVPGVGPKVAAAILDALSPDELLNAAALEDAAAVSQAHGVGKKLAARVVAELKDKAPPMERGLSAEPASAPKAPKAGAADGGDVALRQDAVSALVNLGYDRTQAQRAVAESLSAPEPPSGLDALIRTALKSLSA